MTGAQPRAQEQQGYASLFVSLCVTVCTPGMKGSQASQHSRVLWDPHVEPLKPLQGPMGVAHQVIHCCNLRTPMHALFWVP